MANPVPPIDLSTGTLRTYTDDEVAAMQIRRVGVKDGAHPTHRRRPDDCTITRDYFCAYEELESFLCHMLGYAIIYTDGGGNKKLSRLLPQFYPGLPQVRAVGLEEARGHRFTGEMVDDDSGDPDLPEYDAWRCRITYQHCPYDLIDDVDISSEHRRYVVELPSTVQSDYITMPGGILKYVSSPGGPDGKGIQHSVGIVNTALQIKKKWLKVPYEAWREGSELRKRVFGDIELGNDPWLGTINGSQIFGYAPGQLLLTGVEDQLEFDPIAKERFWNLTYTWLARSVSHNWFYFYDPTGAASGWYFVSNNGTSYPATSQPDGVSVFNARDHLGLFVPDVYP